MYFVRRLPHFHPVTRKFVLNLISISLSNIPVIACDVYTFIIVISKVVASKKTYKVYHATGPTSSFSRISFPFFLGMDERFEKYNLINRQYVPLILNKIPES